MPIICYVAPSVVATIDHQIERAKLVVGQENWIRVDKPERKGAPIPRAERDFVIRDLLRGNDDKLWVYSLDVLADSGEEIREIFRALYRLDIPVVSEFDKMDGGLAATEYAIAFTDALDRADKRCRDREKAMFPTRRPVKGQKTGGRPMALRDSDLAEADRMKNEGRTWPEIAAAFAARGVKVGPDTIMRRVHEWRARN